MTQHAMYIVHVISQRAVHAVIYVHAVIIHVHVCHYSTEAHNYMHNPLWVHSVAFNLEGCVQGYLAKKE